MMILTTLFSYMRLIDEHRLQDTQYFTSMAISNAWLEVPKVLTRSDNSTNVERLWLCLRYIIVLILNVPS